jgi:RNA polymerase sigma factor (sigma-70 family)
MKLLWTWTKNYQWAARPHELIGAGYEGLFRAAEKFDLDNGARLATYAPNWIKNALLQEVNLTRSVVKPGAGEQAPKCLSLNAPADSEGQTEGDTEGDTWQDRLTGDEDGVDSEVESIISDVFAEVAHAVLDNERERQIVTRRYLQEAKRSELASEFGVSRERIRQIEKHAFEKLSEPLREKLEEAGLRWSLRYWEVLREQPRPQKSTHKPILPYKKPKWKVKKRQLTRKEAENKAAYLAAHEVGSTIPNWLSRERTLGGDT